MMRLENPGFLRRPQGAALLLGAVLGAAVIAVEAGVQAEPASSATGGAEEPFRGVTANGQPVYGLFPLTTTGVPAAPVTAAAAAFLESLDAPERQHAQLPLDAPEWREWDYHQYDAPERGVRFAEMGESAQAAALELLEASLSARGFELAQSILRAGLEVGSAERGEGHYQLAVFGEPSVSEPWGWQLKGHHLVINYFVLGDQVVMSPVFLGSGPAPDGRAAAALTDAEERGRALLASLSEGQRQMAGIEAAQDGSGIVAGAFKDNAVVENVGIPASLMDDEQRAALLGLIEFYVGNLREEHAEVQMAQVEARLDDTYFAWSGGSDGGAVSYYRVFSPVILIEFEQRPVGVDGPVHLHAVVRTPNGNDYGRALLHQYLLGGSGSAER